MSGSKHRIVLTAVVVIILGFVALFAGTAMTATAGQPALSVAAPGNSEAAITANFNGNENSNGITRPDANRGAGTNVNDGGDGNWNYNYNGNGNDD